MGDILVALRGNGDFIRRHGDLDRRRTVGRQDVAEFGKETFHPDVREGGVLHLSVFRM